MSKPKFFSQIPKATRARLLTWYNQAIYTGRIFDGEKEKYDLEKDDVPITVAQKQLGNRILFKLTRMFANGEFTGWDCPECGTSCAQTFLSDYDWAQGVKEIDLNYQPGYPACDKYEKGYINQLCDNCRLNLQ